MYIINIYAYTKMNIIYVQQGLRKNIRKDIHKDNRKDVRKVIRKHLRKGFRRGTCLEMRRTPPHRRG